jgi:DNA-binding transcriptional ArsR family regulator
MQTSNFEWGAERLRALADSSRLKIVMLLHKGALTVSEIAAAIGAEIPNVSHHLSILRRCSIVRATKKGRFVYYELHPEVCVTTASGKQNLQIAFGFGFVNFDEMFRTRVSEQRR